MKLRNILADALRTVLISLSALAVVKLMQRFFDPEAIAPMVFVMAVFLISRYTDGYVWGIAASLVSVLAVNFAFTLPYFVFSFTLPENVFSGAVMLVVAVMTSTLTTSLKRQERMRAENEKEKVRANLLRAVSHDLRTPLTAIYGSCSTVIDNYDALTREQKLKLLHEMREDAEWLHRMVENLLSVTRIDAGRVSVKKTPTVLEELIDATLVKFRKHYPGQAVEVEIPEDFVMIPMDSLLIEQVLVNLLENAVCHAQGMTRLELKVTVQGQAAVFTVTDDGCGIPEERLNTLFSGRLAETVPPVDKGRHSMGIGLSVCDTIIRAHGGSIGVASRAGQGTAFRFSLQIDEEDGHEQQ